MTVPPAARRSVSGGMPPTQAALWLAALPRPWIMLAVAIGYGAAVAIGLLMGQLSLDVGTVWLAAGVGIVAVMLWGYWLLPLIAVVHIGVSLAVGTLPLLPRVGMGAVATLEIGLAAWWLSRLQGYAALRFDLAGTTHFALVCVLVVPLGGALAVTAYLWLIGTISLQATFTVARNWWLSVGLGMMTVVPLCTTWLVYGKPRPHIYRREAWLALVALLLPILLIYGYQVSQSRPVEGVFYASLLILFWAGVFLRESGAATGLAVMTLLAVVTSLLLPGEQIPIWSTGAHVVSFGLLALLVANVQSAHEQTMELKARHTELEQWAYQDSLTNLANRHHLRLNLEEAMHDWAHNDAPFAVLMMDLDGFKPINDAYGHDIGDEALRIVASRLRFSRRPDDFIARPGGDEFVIVLHSCDSLEQARMVAERLLDEVQHEMTLPGFERPILLGASIGISHIRQGAERVDELLKQADLALYRSKREGKGRVAVFTSE